MEWFALIPLITQLVSLAEGIFGGQKGAGAVKKSAVMQTTETAVKAMTALSTGGQQETWERLAPTISKAVDVAVDVAKAAGWDKIDNGMVTDNMKNGL